MDSTISGEGAALSATASVADKAGNSTTTSVAGIKIDRSAPSVTASATSGGPTYTAGNWTNQPVVVSFDCSDGLSGVAQSAAPVSVSTDGAAQSATGTCTDKAGNGASATFTDTYIDQTKPTLSPSVSPNPVLLGGAATAIPGATDALSAVASSSCGTPTTAVAGLKTVSCTATDSAGNTATTSVTYQVNYGFGGFLSPVDNAPTVNTGKSGRTYPVKWSLTDATGGFISALTAVSDITYKATSCSSFTNDPTDALETSTSGSSVLRYDSGANQFIYNWQTPTTVTCYTLFVTFDSGQIATAYFKLTK